jgi:hypothetical protein
MKIFLIFLILIYFSFSFKFFNLFKTYDKSKKEFLKLFPLNLKIKKYLDTTKVVDYNLENIIDSLSPQFLKRSLEEKKKQKKPSRDSIFQSTNSEATLIFGTASLENLRKLLDKEKYNPISLGKEDLGIVTIWILKNKENMLTTEIHHQIFVTINVAPKNLGYTLAVEYDPKNYMSLIYNNFLKLKNYSRLFVLKSSTDHKQMRNFFNDIVKIDTDLDYKINSDSDFNSLKNFTKFTTNIYFNGNFETDYTWSHFYDVSKNIFKALGLSAAIDLFDSNYISLKLVNSNKYSDGKIINMYYNFKKQSIFQVKDYEINYLDDNISKLMKDMIFDPKVIIKMSDFQYSLTKPWEQQEDEKFKKQKLDFIETIKKMRTKLIT